MSVAKVCLLVYLLVIQSFAQGSFPPNTGGGTGSGFDCTTLSDESSCVGKESYTCQWVNNTCVNRGTPFISMCYIIDTSDSITRTQFVTLQDALQSHMNTFDQNIWLGVVGYDSNVTVVRDVKPMDVDESPMDAVMGMSNSQTISESKTAEGVMACLESMRTAREMKAATKEFLITVAGRGPTTPNTDLCARGPNSIEDIIFENYINALHIMVGADEVNGNLASINCLSEINGNLLVYELLDDDLNDGSAVINFSLPRQHTNRRLVDRLNEATTRTF